MIASAAAVVQRKSTAIAVGAPMTDALGFLIRRIHQRGDFPALASAISSINNLADDDAGSTSRLADAILRDFALTQKILRLVNSATYSRYSATRTATISRAIVILGFDTVRNLAISLMLLDQIGDRRQAERMREEFLRASLGALLARALSKNLQIGNAEEAYICGLFHRLGRLLSCCYLTEQAETVRRLVAEHDDDEIGAAVRVLGTSYEALGIGVARTWGFPEAMIDSLRHLAPGAAGNGATPTRVLSSLACEIGALFELPEPGARDRALEPLLLRYHAVLPVPTELALRALREAEAGLDELAQAFEIDRRGTVFERVPQSGPETATAVDGEQLGVGQAEATTGAKPVHDPDATLAVGIQDLSDALLEGSKLSDVLRIVTETVYRALRPQRVLVCLRDGRSGEMQARFALGDQADARRPNFRFVIGRGDDLFNRIIAREHDVLIADSTEPKVKDRLPPWYRQHFAAPSFLVMPLRLREVPVAMIYADHAQANGLVIAPTTLTLLRTLRKQALLAIKTAQG